MFYTDLSNWHRTTKVPQIDTFQLNARDVLLFKVKNIIWVKFFKCRKLLFLQTIKLIVSLTRKKKINCKNITFIILMF